VSSVNFESLVDQQYNLIRAEVGSVTKWDESYSRICDSYDAFHQISSVGKADYALAVSLANLYAEVKRSYVDHRIQDNKSLESLVDTKVKENRKTNKVTSVGEGRGKVILSFYRLTNHLSVGSLGGTVKPLLCDLAATIYTVATDLGLPLVEPETVETTEVEPTEHNESGSKRKRTKS